MCHDEAPAPPPEDSLEIPRPAQRCTFVGQDTSSPPLAPNLEPPWNGREPVLVRFRPGAQVRARGRSGTHRATVEHLEAPAPGPLGGDDGEREGRQPVTRGGFPGGRVVRKLKVTAQRLRDSEPMVSLLDARGSDQLGPDSHAGVVRVVPTDAPASWHSGRAALVGSVLPPWEPGPQARALKGRHS